MDEMPSASRALEKLGIPHRVFHHPGVVKSLEQAARERGQRPEQIVRSVLFRLAENEYMMVLAAGPVQISWKALRRHLGQSRLRMASEPEVLRVTGHRIGTVSPFGLPRPLKVLLDASLLKEKEISLGSGMPNTGIIMQSMDLQRALGDAEVVNLVENP